MEKNNVCVACCKGISSFSSTGDIILDGELLEMFNFVCCLEADDNKQVICTQCLDELKISFNFKKRCLEIFANIFHDIEEEGGAQHEEHFDEQCLEMMDSMLDQTLHEDENSLNLTDLLPSITDGTDRCELSVLEVSDKRCRFCFVDFLTKEDCTIHAEEHKDQDKPYLCPHEGCNSAFKARKNLKDHYLVHSSYRPFSCHFCQQSFKSSSNRSKHERRIHSRERLTMQRSATKTNTKFPHVKAVRKTLPPPASHTAESVVPVDMTQRIFKCNREGCLSSFKTRSSLRDHQKVHSDARDYNCGFCSKAFKSSSNRSKHERAIHQEEYQKRKYEREALKNNGETGDTSENDEPSLKKSIVELPVGTKLIVHESASTKKMMRSPKDFPCRYCFKCFKKAEKRERHEAGHKDNNYDCRYCDTKPFRTQGELQKHLKNHTDRHERRSIRNESSHIKTSETKFPCEEEGCNKSFLSRKSLKHHKTIKHNEAMSFPIKLNEELREHL